MTVKTIAEILTELGACPDAIDWAKGRDDPETAWKTCERGDWLLWIAAEIGVRRQDVAGAACKCARLALEYIKPGEDRPLKAIEITESWTKGKSTIDQVRKTKRAAAYATAYATAVASADYDAYASYASDAAATAAADAAAYAAAYTAYTADAAATAADDASAASVASVADAAKRTALKQCADLVRETISFDAIKTLIPGG
jgi:hypothetical protein